MQVDPGVIIAAPLAVLAWTLVFALGKGALVAVVARALPTPLRSRFGSASSLAHGGEFGLLLLTQAIAAGVIAAGRDTPCSSPWRSPWPLRPG